MEKIQDIENIVNNKNDKLDLLYKTKLKNIKKSYKKIKDFLILIISESNSKLNTYKSIYSNIKTKIIYNNKYDILLGIGTYSQYSKYKNHVNAQINLIVANEIDLEYIRLEIFKTNGFNLRMQSIESIHPLIKSFIGVNHIQTNNLLVNCVYPKLLTISGEAFKISLKEQNLKLKKFFRDLNFL
mgnify:CR=1 FL=1